MMKSTVEQSRQQTDACNRQQGSRCRRAAVHRHASKSWPGQAWHNSSTSISAITVRYLLLGNNLHFTQCRVLAQARPGRTHCAMATRGRHARDDGQKEFTGRVRMWSRTWVASKEPKTKELKFRRWQQTGEPHSLPLALGRSVSGTGCA